MMSLTSALSDSWTGLQNGLKGRPRIIEGALLAVAVVLWFVISSAAPGVVHEMLERSLGHPEKAHLSAAEINRTALGLTWVLWPLALVALAAAVGRTIGVALGAAALTAFALYLLGSIPGELAVMAKDKGWPTPEQAAFASALAGQVLAIVLTASLILVAWRGDWSTFAVALIGFLGAGAIWLGISTALQKPFEPQSETKRGEISVDAAVIGVPLAADQPVSVVFLIPKRNDEGLVTAVEQTTRDAVAAAPALCAPKDQTVCTVRLIVERGDKDASIAAWLADRAAASAVFVIGPTGVPSASPTSP